VGDGGLDELFVGWWCATPPLPITGPPSSAELGWRLRRERWGEGLATEGAAAVVEHCFGTVGLDQLTAETMAVNAASRGVMRKLGMTHVRTEVREWDDPLPGAEEGEAVYALSRTDWASR
jgi:RimJ/RimL family protein N-acetyltransferase